jgi:glucoamylase
VARISYARVATAGDDSDLVEFAATAQVFMRRNVAARAGAFHDANDPAVPAAAGCVIASPSYPAADPGLTDQNYVFHWIRDAALTAVELSRAPVTDGHGVDRALCDYVAFSRVCQDSAAAAGRFFLARFRVDGAALTTGWDAKARAYTGHWSQQKDGPALQSLSFAAAWPHLDAPARAVATAVAQRNLDETVRAWADDDGVVGPWEDVSGPSFFARAAQVRFLDEVATANVLGLDRPAGLDAARTGLRAALDAHWDPAAGRYASIPGGTIADYDPNADVVLACLHGAVPCTDPRLLATAAQLRAAFDVGGGHEYPINRADRAQRGVGPLVGRYPGDTYDGDVSRPPDEGQPWALCTAALAQLHYLVAAEVAAGRGPAWDDLTAGFFTRAGVAAAAVRAGGRDVADALTAAGDAMLRAVVAHSAAGHLSEQFDKVTGYAKSVEDLTWSYAAFTAAVRARPTPPPGS